MTSEITGDLFPDPYEEYPDRREHDNVTLYGRFLHRTVEGRRCKYQVEVEGAEPRVSFRAEAYRFIVDIQNSDSVEDELKEAAFEHAIELLEDGSENGMTYEIEA